MFVAGVSLEWSIGACTWILDEALRSITVKFKQQCLQTGGDSNADLDTHWKS